MAWKLGLRDLKSLFSENRPLLSLNAPFAFVSSSIFAWHPVGSCFKKLFLYVVSSLKLIYHIVCHSEALPQVFRRS